MCSLSGGLTVDVTSFMRCRITLVLTGVVLRITSLEGHEEGAQRGGIDPCRAGEDRALGSLVDDEVLQLHLEGLCHTLNS
jgi:hypothetical protein